MLTKLKNLLIYGGLDKEEFDDVFPYVWKTNSDYLPVYSGIGIALFALMSFISLFESTNATANRNVYIVCLCISILIFVLARYSENQVIDSVLGYIFQMMLYGFSVTLMLIHPDMPSVTAIVLMVIIPLLFTYRPITTALITLGVNVLYCIVEITTEKHSIASMNMGNTIVFGCMAICIGVFTCMVRIKTVVQTRKIELLSQIDLLTGLLNRNSYEKNIEEYPYRISKSICCVYGDVNGLHEVNNTQGHEAGDLMLKIVAKEFQKQFGKANSFRIGGDEFVSFALDEKENDVLDKILFIDKICAKQGYHVSIGHYYAERDNLDMTNMIKTAEREMYERKFEYYNDNRIDRRKRR